MADWDDIARDNLEAAQVLAAMGHYRSCASRGYYAAFSAVSFVLRDRGPFERGRDTPAHHRIVALIGEHLGAHLSPHRLRNLKATLRRLYNSRIDADYRARIAIDQRAALSARQDAHTICRELGVLHASGH